MKSIQITRLLLSILTLTFFFSCDYPGNIEIVPVELYSVSDIISLNDSIVTPVEYINTISLDELEIDEKKEKFIDLILPSILIAKHHLKLEQYRLKKFINKDTSKINIEDKVYLTEMLRRFKADSLESLINKLETHPTSIVIAQAALESGWGTSRFFTEANNIFGVWSYNPYENRIKSTFSRNGQDIFLRKYDHLHESVSDYFFTLARGPYKKFRNKRLETNDPFELIPLLYNYSELRNEYIMNLEKVINSSDLTKYDSYTINKKYINKYW